MKRRVIDTADGSKTIQIEDWDEQYHSIHGALQEALHVFIQNTEARLNGRKEISILEMGFGTGLNALLTWKMAEELSVKVQYTTLEAFPIEFEEYAQLDFQNVWGEKPKNFYALHEATWDEKVVMSSNFSLEKKRQTFEEYKATSKEFDFVFYDAFGPRVQPHLWTIPIFHQLFKSCKPGGTFLTYCAKGQVRRDLQSVGFEMERLPGPPGKREMLMGKVK
ncbi:MAG: tRNA U34 5-methylaminomethyl-2-thiouridine-forming methyltransferase MnmC [Lentimonas sp.]|jgi:tRNA U34 5-methylaminomethyl-2-thiouridine-forming methyltransferase MnmC